MPTSAADEHPEYWLEYSNLQHVKHSLIRNYLSGWFPKLALGPWGSRRLVYIDTHAGRGRHLHGQLGSPLVALTTLLNHSSRDRILENTEVRLFFIERDDDNLSALQQELSGIRLPRNVQVSSEADNAFAIIDGAITALDKEGTRLAPSFVFVDPYGFKLPGELLCRLLSYPKTELFVNVIWRELDMAISNARRKEQPGMLETLNLVFHGDRWSQIDSDDHNERAQQCVTLLTDLAGAKWGTYIWMLHNNRIRYFLLHLTNHDAGRDLMKECIWKACPDGGYCASKSDNPHQLLLIEPEPDLERLRDWVVDSLSDRPWYWQDLTDELREELWLGKHLNQVIRAMRQNEEIIADDYEGRFAQTNNPRLRLVGDQKERGDEELN